jgi:parallel beta-helix repeat protein
VLFVNANASGSPRDGTSWAKGYGLVQDALNSAVGGDEIWVAAGIYTQTLTLKKDISLYGGFAGTETARAQRNPLANVTVLDGNRGGAVVTCPADLTATTVLDGFRITNGKAGTGGGVYIIGSAPVIRNNVITDNQATDGSWGGGAIFLQPGSAALIASNLFARNTAALDAGAIYCYRDTSRIVNNVFAFNTAGRWGGGIRTSGASPTIANNTFVGNSAANDAGAIRLRDGGSPTIANNIVAFNTSGVRVDDASPRLRYNCTYGNASYDYSGVTVTTADGNTFADPMISPDSRGVWHILPSSPCRNAGDSTLYVAGDFDIDGQPRMQGVTIDIGADESDGSTPAAWSVHVRADGDDGNDGYSWDHPKRSVQAGITLAALTGGEVWVAAETYTELVTMAPGVQVYGGFAGDEATRDARDPVANVTMIDGNLGGTVVTFPYTTSQNCVLDGFTVTNGQAKHGGGIGLFSSSATVRRCIITGNTATTGDLAGGGIYTEYASPTIVGNIITHNTTVNGSTDGGGIACYGGTARIADNVITYNHATRWGGGIRTWGSGAVFANNTVTNNSADADGGAIAMREGSSVTLVSNIFAYNNSGVFKNPDSSPRIRYNDVWGNTRYQYSVVADATGADGNIMLDPVLVSDARGVMHIAATSPCKDAGDNSAVKAGETDIDVGARVVNGRVDIGADETTGAALTPVVVRVRSDGSDANDGSTWAKAKRRVQAGVDAVAPTGGEVWVAAGTYIGVTTLAAGVRVYGGFTGSETARDARNWRTNATVLDGNKGGSVVALTDGGSADTVLDGFTITNGQAPYGGGIRCQSSGAVFRNNLIVNNTATSTDYGGGGVYAESYTPTFINNTIRNNTASARDGGGIYCYGGYARVVSNTISSNSSARFGGGVYCYGSYAVIANNTLTGNSTGSNGGAMEFENGGSPEAVNNVVALNNTGLRADGGAVPRLRYNDLYANTNYDYYNITDPTGMDGNVDWNPLLVMDAQGNPHLAPTSPCINAGDNSVVMAGDTDIDSQSRIQNSFVDLGADESDGTVPTPQIIRVKPSGNDANDGSTWALAKKRVQAAIDAAALTGGEVWVMKGTYTGLVTMPYAVSAYGGFAGTETSRSQRNYRANLTILDANKGGSVVAITNGCGPDTVLDGFTLRNGTGTQYDGYLVGGGIYIYYSSPTVRNNTITGNSVATGWEYGGGGIFAVGAWPQILSNTIRNNTSSRNGGGVYLNGSNARVANNTIAGNTVPHSGGGVFARSGSSPSITNNTIVNNTANDYGGGASAWDGANVSYVNNIIAFNSSGLRADSCDPRFRYNDVYGNVSATWSNLGDPTGSDGNFSADPMVSTDAHGDVHIAGASPCRNAGDNSVVLLGDADIDGQARILGGTVDIGADETDGSLPPVPVIRVKPDGDDLKDGSSWANAKRRIQPAIDLTAATGGEVWVAKGTYTGSISLPVGVQLYGGFAGTESARGQRNWTANETILDGNRSGSVVSISGSQGRDTVLDGFTVTDGSGTQYETSFNVGGGLYCYGASPTISHNTFIANAASGNGYGGAGAFVVGASPLFSANVFRENVSSRDGGGLYLRGSNAIVQDCLFLKNSAAYRGGGVMVYEGGSPTLANCTIVANTAANGHGGGMWDYNGCTPTVVNTIVAYNDSGIRQDSADARLRNCDVFGNTAYDYSNIGDPTGIDGNIMKDPLFVARATDDYHISAASPCVDAGDDTQVAAGSTDLGGSPRLNGVHVDIGAYEVSLNITTADALLALKIAAGLSNTDSAGFTHLNLATAGASLTKIDVCDALAIARALNGK